MKNSVIIILKRLITFSHNVSNNTRMYAPTISIQVFTEGDNWCKKARKITEIKKRERETHFTCKCVVVYM